jgi:hypothetical protein
MADQMFMFVTMAGTMAALAALLFVSSGIRRRGKRISSEGPSFSSSSSNQNIKENKTNKDKKVKRYTSDGKPAYE